MHINCPALHPRSESNERWHVLGFGGASRRQRMHTPRITQTSKYREWARSNYLSVVHSGGSNKQSHSPGSKLGEIGAWKSVFMCSQGRENKSGWRIRCAHCVYTREFFRFKKTLGVQSSGRWLHLGTFYPLVIWNGCAKSACEKFTPAAASTS